MAANLRLKALPDGTTLLSTETRVRCADRFAYRLFACYWLVIRPFSHLIRREMLEGIRGRALVGPPAPGRPV